MVQPIMKDTAFLAQKAEPATEADLAVAANLLETLVAHSDACVGMAANMIGVNKRIIAFTSGDQNIVMMNPTILKASEPYKTKEGCLSLEGLRETKRYFSIKVQYQNEKMQTRIRTYTGWEAQIIQHEIDHCEGILI